MQDQVVEWVPFRVKPGVDEATLLKLADGLQKDFLAKQSGYQRRELVKAKDGEYVDIIWWSSMEDAEEAMKHVADSPQCSAYFAAMDYDPNDPAAHPLHFKVVRGY